MAAEVADNLAAGFMDQEAEDHPQPPLTEAAFHAHLVRRPPLQAGPLEALTAAASTTASLDSSPGSFHQV